SNASGAPVTVNAGGGNDTVNIGGGNLSNLHAAVIVDGQAGTDKVNVNDQANAPGDSYTVTSTTLTRAPFARLTYPTTERLTLNADAAYTALSGSSNALGVPLTVNAGGGNDTINVGNGNLDNLKGAVAVNGQAGTDKVNVSDQANARGDTYTVTSSTVARPTFA